MERLEQIEQVVGVFELVPAQVLSTYRYTKEQMHSVASTFTEEQLRLFEHLRTQTILLKAQIVPDISDPAPAIQMLHMYSGQLNILNLIFQLHEGATT